jgi:leader peptidase (prepilin peptidase)/N-methyltransferase
MSCGNAIAWRDNIPLLSWLMLGARCRHCKAPISWQYPLVEGLTAVLFALVFLRHGMTLATPIYMLLAGSLVLVTFVDLTDWTIPNEVTFPGIPLGLVCAIIAMFYPESGLFVLTFGSMPLIFSALLGLFVGGGVLYVLDKVAVAVLNKRGMGFGDVKLMAMLGAFFGLPAVLMILLIASVTGAVVGLTVVARQRLQGVEESAHYLPFGPYLSFAGVVVMLFGQELYTMYIGQIPATEF